MEITELKKLITDVPKRKRVAHIINQVNAVAGA